MAEKNVLAWVLAKVVGRQIGAVLSKENIAIAEREIDEAFAETELVNIGYCQAVWTLLSVVEDHHYKIRVYDPLNAAKQDIYIDGLLNALTYPLRVCHAKFHIHSTAINRSLNQDDYEAANRWIDKAGDYTNFCSIFPLYHKHEIELHIESNKVIKTDWRKYDLSYEVYDRFVKMRHPEIGKPSDPNVVAEIVRSQTLVKGDSFKLKFKPKLVKVLRNHLQHEHRLRFTLPEHWEFCFFSIREFKEVFTTIQSMSYGWFMARQFACRDGVADFGFKDSLWTPGRAELVSRLIRYTGVPKDKVDKILEYLTFGKAGIRNPDIAVQPIVDLKNGEIAISTFVFLNVNCERNLCVLLNQINEERKIYSRLVEEKEANLRDEIISRLSKTGYEFKFGKLDGTDVDLAIVDRKNKKCITIELKWFIEPAEIREVIQRSEEVRKGVEQAKKISKAWKSSDSRLLCGILGVDKSFDHLAVVAPVTSIGNLSAQDMQVPVIKTWHLIDEINKSENLGKVMEWLKNREYLPKVGVEFNVEEIEIISGKWSAIWYGITHA